LRDVRGLGHERRRRFPHPAWPHPLDPRAAARPFIAQALAAAQKAGAASRAPAGSPRQSLALRARPAASGPANRLLTAARAAPSSRRASSATRPRRAARPPSQLSAPRGRDPRRREGPAVRPGDR
jgi:hypothetical protein